MGTVERCDLTPEIDDATSANKIAKLETSPHAATGLRRKRVI
jgi:hypothetical protein